MSKLRDLHARMADITARLRSQDAGGATEIIQRALTSAGLTSPTPSGSAAPQSLRKLLTGLGTGPAPWSNLPGAAPDADTADEKFISSTLRGRRYKTYVPSSYRGQAMPLVVMLHGCTQDPDDFARGTQMNALAEEKGFVVLYPAQDASANASKCWNWFNAIDQQRGQGEPALIAAMTNEVIERYSLDRERVYVAGLSAGGAMAVIMGATYPDLYRAVGVHSGLPYAAASDLPSALSAMKGISRRRNAPHDATLPIIVFHGDRDTTVSPANGRVLIDDFANGLDQADHVSTLVEQGKAAGGRQFSRTTLHADGKPVLAEHWVIHGAGHAWAGGSAAGTYTDAQGPDASREMFRFFSTQGADRA
ncbi:PHB depolymerase family esterase [Herbaspirillum sp. YR522]|uniref:extracellular catalytic domain type 1 short-chain-length polyhydroxyalkanoate depolymerase n=1 Tax=Herbaspirillum sp. YR522 TaxID=1144342 RepID=UPI00026FCDB0|nr:PHB depolymerase family esterase [Herbaspirillum sp. YR522]EJM97551.1 esterase, PHB depolymerase family [Herbaspirillum sp. YR522]